MSGVLPARVVLFVDGRGWHERRLRAAFARLKVDLSAVSLSRCRFELRTGVGGIVIPGLAGRLPDAAFVRSVPGGSFEAVTRRLDVLHALADLGVVVYNDARVIERTVDKAMCSYRLAQAGIPTPPTWVCESERQARALVRRETAAGRRVVLKPVFGSRGRGLRLLDASSALPPPEDCNGVYYLQRFVPREGELHRDWRVMVVGGRAVAAMERRSSDWVTNRARGGECLPAACPEPLARVAEDAAEALGAAYAGVDVVRAPGGAYRVLEVNGIPAWRGLQHTTGVDLARMLVADLMGRVLGARAEAAS